MTTLNSRLQLALLNRKKGRNALEKGFTLVELLIVIVILGVLSAVALPNFLGARDKAEAGALLGTMQGFAKECAVNAVGNNPAAVTVPAGVTQADTDCSDGSSMTNSTPFTAARIGGLRCGTDTANGTSDATCTINISTDGVITGTWG